MKANSSNRDAFAADWVRKHGGNYRNAVRVWQVEAIDNIRRDLSTPFPSQEELRKAGLMETGPSGKTFDSYTLRKA